MIAKKLEKINLPDILSFKNGEKITTIKDWETRREELKKEFQSKMYGNIPAAPKSIRFEEISADEYFCAGKTVLRKVNIICELENGEFEVPFFTFVQAMGEKLLGNKAFAEFGGYFPIRFNYDDTFHASGNMSIQLHPGEKFVTEENGELGRQDESYYIVATGQDAKTYLGFKQDADIDEFLDGIKRARLIVQGIVRYGNQL